VQIILRNAARQLGLKLYFTGRPCGAGHTAARYTSTGHCLTCRRRRNWWSMMLKVAALEDSEPYCRVSHPYALMSYDEWRAFRRHMKAQGYY
jgi:hypothetical protein